MSEEAITGACDKVGLRQPELILAAHRINVEVESGSSLCAFPSIALSESF